MALGHTLKQRPSFKPPALQITSMMDMFTIIVFFLLFSYSERPDEFDLSRDLELPASTTDIDYKNSISLFISTHDIKVDGNVVGVIEGLKVKGLDSNSIESSALFSAFTKFKQQKSSSLLESSDNQDDKKTPHVLVFCDRSIPFKTLNMIVKTAGLAGFTNFQLAVTEAG